MTMLKLSLQALSTFTGIRLVECLSCEKSKGIPMHQILPFVNSVCNVI